MSEPVTGTFLFTDLVGSTALTAGLDDDAAEALRATHFGLLRSALDAAGGTEVKNLGDGVMAYFPSTTRALASAVSMQQSFERHNRRADDHLFVRIGVSMGDAVEENGDYFGTPVVEAARLCAAADGGQILTTEVVRLVVGRHATHELVPIGPMELKGLPDPVDAVAVLWEPAADPDRPDGEGVPFPAPLIAEGGRALFAFFGRADETSTLAHAMKAAEAEARLQAVFVGGEPGIGKTALVAQAARAGHAAGATVLYGSCAEELAVPYRPWITAVGHLLAASPDLCTTLSPAHTGALARLVPSLAERLPSTVPAVSDPESERYLLMEAVVELLTSASRDACVIIVLDDLHWADDASVHLLRHALRSSTSMRVALFCTYRSSELRRGGTLTGVVADSHGDARVARVELGGLADVEVAALIEAAAGYESDEGVALAHALHRETDGNAFFVTELLRHLAESGGIAPSDDGRYRLAGGIDDLALPQSVREVVGHRVARLGDDVARVLGLAAVIGAEFGVDVLAQVADVDGDLLLDLLEVATGAAIVAETSTPGRFRFGHALLQHTVLEELGATRRQRAHRRVAEALEAAESGEASSAELARHWLAATEPTNREKAAMYAERAGDTAMAALAPSDAVEWYRQVVELLERDPEGSERELCRVLIRLASAQSVAGLQGEHDATLRRATASARRLADPQLLLDAALSPTPGSRIFLPVDDDRTALIEAALAAVGRQDSVERARLLTLLAEEADPLDWRRRHDLIAEAITLVERLGDAPTFVEVVTGTCMMVGSPHTLPRRLELLARAREAVSHETVNPAIQANLLHTSAQALLEHGDFEGYAAMAGEFISLGDETRLPVILGMGESASSLRCLLRGDVATAEIAADEALRWYEAAQHPAGPFVYGALIENVRIAQGRADEIVSLFEEATAAAEVMPSFEAELTRLYRQVGDRERCSVLFDSLVDRGLVERFPQDGMWFLAMRNLADTAVWLDRPAPAAVLHDVLLPFADLMPCTILNWGGSAHATLAGTAALLGRIDESEAHNQAALAFYRRFDIPFWLAETLLAHAERLRSSGRAGDTEVAARDRAEAVDIAVRYGFAGLIRRAEAPAL